MVSQEKFSTRNPKVSVIMPSWNRAYCIKGAIRSILDQTYENWELIIVDDGSVDDTYETIKHFLNNKIKYLKTSHQGIGMARNYGIAHSTGQLITSQDSDDLSFPDRLKRLVNYADKYDVIYSGLYIRSWDEVNQVIGRVYVPAPRFDKERLLKEQYIPGPCLFKKKVWELKPYRKEVGSADDWMAYIDWAMSGFKFKALNMGLYEYIRNWDSATIQTVKDGTQKELFKTIQQIAKKEYA